ncbi:MAG TPA: class I SAM-dependent methyltransferase [Thermomicrobiales bacterium]|nr:class I SAM-dependent methyltransferase [Thermomicrobiales bacterium]
MTPRATVLRWCFNALYGRLAFAHEVTGWIAFGAAWDARRGLILDRTRTSRGVVLDIGCGDGRLLERYECSRVRCLGVEPSPGMARRANARGAFVVRARAEQLPARSSSVATIVSTYPGPWIMSAETHTEIARVAAVSCDVWLLLGGTYERGPGAGARRLVTRMAYGRQTAEPPDMAIPGFIGSWEIVSDAWGSALVWHGRRWDQRPADGRTESSSSS